MPWKVDENGAVEVQDGNPVWIYEGGDKDRKEAPVDFKATLGTIQRLTGETMDRKNKLNQAREKLKPLEDAGIEDVAEYLTKATAALEVTGNLDDKQILDNEGIEAIKKPVRDSYEHNIAELKKSHVREIETLTSTVQEKEANIRDLIIRSAFDQSEFLREQTVLLPDIAYGYFGDRFDVEMIDGKPIGYAKDAQGNKLVSLKNPGETASPLEAIELLVNDHPQKDRILKMESSGAGTPAGGLRGKGGDDLLSQYKKAKQNKDVLAMTSLKRKMAEAGIKAPL